MNEFHQTFIKRPVSKENTPTETKMKTEFQAFSQKLYYLMSLLCKGYRVTHAHLDK